MPPRPDDPDDPKGLIHEAFRIEGIALPECRSIFVDWALSLPGDAASGALSRLVHRFGRAAPDHPMTAVLREGLAEAGPPRRRGGRAARIGSGGR